MKNTDRTEEQKYSEVFDNVRNNLLRDIHFFGFARPAYDRLEEKYSSMTEKEKIQEGKRLVEINKWDIDKI